MRKECYSDFMRWHGRSVCHFFLCHSMQVRRHADRFTHAKLDAFIRDELSKGRYDPAISKVCFEMLLELFGRTLKIDLGEHDGKKLEVEDVC